ncbi:uncharacterized protein B0I36DRAFT_143281 [Microdochium trichocladiopsis]|uniref:Uncharacterized protein n=1 Tax=Microdochium trichocladiopsis TaxID=1682393 RepID=A0A9P9BNI7_9PEZI|nr:uncharacterized protein B0I36DRAFT_143281 [Microdochium trichocladiopsis]KAH7027776.1 hypothetical protein B0I36DRAFT_143281 [Microdochium trichocladiopsis]
MLPCSASYPTSAALTVNQNQERSRMQVLSSGRHVPIRPSLDPVAYARALSRNGKQARVPATRRHDLLCVVHHHCIKAPAERLVSSPWGVASRNISANAHPSVASASASAATRLASKAHGKSSDAFVVVRCWAADSVPCTSRSSGPLMSQGCDFLVEQNALDQPIVVSGILCQAC